MIAIGIRAAPKLVTFVIYDSQAQKIANVETIKIPAAFSKPDALKYVRGNILDILREYKVTHAGIRAFETVGPLRANIIPRIEIEGVIQEAFASSPLVFYYVGNIATIASRLNIERKAFKPLIDGTATYDLEGWEELGKEAREAALCAIGAVDD